MYVLSYRTICIPICSSYVSKCFLVNQQKTSSSVWREIKVQAQSQLCKAAPQLGAAFTPWQWSLGALHFPFQVDWQGWDLERAKRDRVPHRSWAWKVQQENKWPAKAQSLIMTAHTHRLMHLHCLSKAFCKMQSSAEQCIISWPPTPALLLALFSYRRAELN